MSRVILARRRASVGEPPGVHAWRVPDADGQAYRSACGQFAVVDDLDGVERFTGAPCTVCLLLATGAADRAELSADDRAVLVEAPEPVDAEPVVIAVNGRTEPPAGGGYRYGVALRGERHAHLVEPDAVRGYLDGRDVVQTLCMFLAWGPLDAPPHEWPTCDECAEIAAAVRT